MKCYCISNKDVLVLRLLITDGRDSPGRCTLYAPNVYCGSKMGVSLMTATCDAKKVEAGMQGMSIVTLG